MDVKTFCLAVLSRGDATGYEIKKACEEGRFPGRLYSSDAIFNDEEGNRILELLYCECCGQLFFGDGYAGQQHYPEQCDCKRN